MTDVLKWSAMEWRSHVTASTGDKRLAECVARLANEYHRQVRLTSYLQEDLQRTLDRLHKHEPPAPPAEPRNYR